MDSKNLMDKSVDDIEFINNIMPSIFEKISTEEFVTYESKKLKSSYLIDLVSYIISNFFLTKDTEVSLSSTVLRKRYGADYNFYVKYCVEFGIIKLRKKHLNGKNSRIYELNKKIIINEIKTFKNFDKYLLKKYKLNYKKLDYVNYSNNLIESDIKQKLVHDLYHVSIDIESSEYLLNSLLLEKTAYESNKFSVDCIHKKQLYFHFDNFGRMHTNFTNLKSTIRKSCLFIDGEKTMELDIKNSQPLFLNKLIDEHKDEFNFDDDEIKFYKHLTLSGNFYHYLSQKFNMKDMKTLKDIVYKVLFGKNYPNNNEKIFKSFFPNIYSFIIYYKKNNGGYKSIAHKLQNLESNFIYNNTIRSIMDRIPDAKLITVHDSIICKQSDFEAIKSIFFEKMISEFNTHQVNTIESKSEINIYEYDDAP